MSSSDYYPPGELTYLCLCWSNGPFVFSKTDPLMSEERHGVGGCESWGCPVA